jgi:hypothetical protein
MNVGYLFTGMLGHLPLLAVLVAGFVLVATRRRRLGPRSVLFARLGLGALAAGSVLQVAWTMLLPTVYSRLEYSATRYGLLFSGVGLVTSLVSAAGVGLLIVALVTREPGRSFAGPPGPGFGEPPVDHGQPYGAADRPAGPPFTG